MLLHPEEPIDDDPNVPRVWIRPSQLKIKHDPHELLDPAHRIIDVLQFCKVRYPSRVSHEMIINLDSNGVKLEDMLELMKTGLKEYVDQMMDWEGPDAMRRLLYNVNVQGAVVSTRLMRESKAEMRIRTGGERKFTFDKIA